MIVFVTGGGYPIFKSIIPSLLFITFEIVEVTSFTEFVESAKFFQKVNESTKARVYISLLLTHRAL